MSFPSTTGCSRAADLAGELGHPVGADVPDLCAHDPRAVLHRHRRFRLHALHQRAARLRGHGGDALHLHVGVRMRSSSSRLVDHPVAPGRGRHCGGRERERRARRAQLRRRAAATTPAGNGGRPSAVGLHQGRRPAGALHSLVQNLSQVGLVFVLLVGGWMVIHDDLPVASIISFNLYLVMMQAPFMMLGMLIMMGQRASASADRIYEILDEQPTIVDRPGAIDLVDSQGDVEFDDVTFSYAADSLLSKPDDEDDGRQGHSAPPQPAPAPWRDRRPGRRTGSGKSTRGPGPGPLLRRDRRHCPSRRPRRTRPHPHQPSGQHWRRPRRAVPLLGVHPGQHRLRPARRLHGGGGRRRRPPAQPGSSTDCPRATRPWSASAATRCRAGSASASPSPAPCSVNPPILILDDATSAIDVKVEQRIHSALRVLMEGRTTLIIAHRLSTISLADRVVLLDGGQIVADGTTPTSWRRRPCTPRCWRRRPATRMRPKNAAAGTDDLGPGRHRPGARGGCILMFGGGGGRPWAAAARRARPRPGCPSAASLTSCRLASISCYRGARPRRVRRRVHATALAARAKKLTLPAAHGVPGDVAPATCWWGSSALSPSSVRALSPTPSTTA